MNRFGSTLALAAALGAGNAICAEPLPAVDYLNSGKVLPKNLPFSELVRHGNTLYLSGQVGIEPGTMKIVPGGIEREAKQAMDNIKTSLEAHGYSLGNLVMCTVMLADIADWPAFNEVYKAYFSGDYPARSAFGASGLALGAKVEVECIGAVGERCCKAKPGRF
jgi:2-iminobutanoate/2-iminopropanoate deaminase